MEYYAPTGDLNDVGGLDVLKEWLIRRRKHFTKAAKDWQCQTPRGILLLGVPGCGKSLCAKTVGKEWDMPTIKFDIGKVYSSLLGQDRE